jgi:hypothetical protein
MHRRDLLKLGAATLASSLNPALAASSAASTLLPSEKTEQWGLFELTFPGPSTGNPFQDVTLTAVFTLDHRSVSVTGFYDGEGVYRFRFMPDQPGHWTFRTASSAPQLDGHTGAFTCTPPSPGNHGPVTTAHQFHFQHADATPYFPFGTTTYAVLFTAEQPFHDSLAGLRQAGFNKTRACVLPKPLGDKSEQMLPFPRTGTTNDLTRFNTTYFQLLERRILALQQAGVQADLILFHPYDAWGYKSMPAASDDFYLRYTIARLSAFRNIWWALANEYDLIKAKTTADWDRLFRITQAEDPYSHLRSIHHSRVIYDNSKPWVTHASLQSYDFEKSAARRLAWNKPIVYDEIQYEGDVDRRWGNLSAEEMTRRFWLAIIDGAYASHGEVFISESGQPSWSDAGALRGESAPRIAFLRKLIERITPIGLNEFEGAYYLSAGDPDHTILYYFDYHRPARYDFPLPATATFRATLIDPYAMTETPIPGAFSGKSRLTLANKPYQAVLFQKVSDTHSKPATSTEPLVPSNEPG